MEITAPADSPAPTGPGRSAQSTGHQAKAAVAAAREAGIELPKNAQGLAASQIARGVEAALVFQPPEPPAPDAAPGTDPVDGTAPTGTDMPDAAPEAGGTNDAEMALALLTAAAGYDAAAEALAPQ